MENAVRLVGSPCDNIDNMGRVEVCVDGIFRRVTSSEFEESQAAAVCEQLGLPGSSLLVKIRDSNLIFRMLQLPLLMITPNHVLSE